MKNAQNQLSSAEIIVSSITPCFRMKKYLKLFLEELPNQTMFEQLEIVIDHNEPDEEEIAWVKDFQKKYPGRIKHIIVPKVDPIGTSMNRCIKVASGKYVTIWNVDDLRTPNSIELQVAELEKNPEVGIAYGNFLVVRSFGSKEGPLTEFSHYQQSELTRSMITGPFIMFRKSLCEKAGYFDEQLKSGADFDLSVRLGFNAKASMPRELLGYYLNEGLGASTRPNSKQPLDRTTIELRYGIYDKIDYDIVPRSTAEHNIPFIMQDGKWIHVSKLVPDYAKVLENRRIQWFAKGMRRYILQKIFFVKPIKAKLKPIIKPLLGR
jgi:glycosyltransferase involved in cell wall biosynthesis